MIIATNSTSERTVTLQINLNFEKLTQSYTVNFSGFDKKTKAYKQESFEYKTLRAAKNKYDRLCVPRFTLT